jgi:hypothetical protein
LASRSRGQFLANRVSITPNDGYDVVVAQGVGRPVLSVNPSYAPGAGMVEPTGIEPVTSAVRLLRSPN